MRGEDVPVKIRIAVLFSVRERDACQAGCVWLLDRQSRSACKPTSEDAERAACLENPDTRDCTSTELDRRSCSRDLRPSEADARRDSGRIAPCTPWTRAARVCHVRVRWHSVIVLHGRMY